MEKRKCNLFRRCVENVLFEKTKYLIKDDVESKYIYLVPMLLNALGVTEEFWQAFSFWGEGPLTAGLCTLCKVSSPKPHHTTVKAHSREGRPVHQACVRSKTDISCHYRILTSCTNYYYIQYWECEARITQTLLPARYLSDAGSNIKE